MDKKRSRDQLEVQNLEMAQCLVLLSNAKYSKNTVTHATNFECKTCNKKFSSFQALGGHRASHKKPKHWTTDKSSDDRSSDESVITSSLVAKKPKKMHKCSICGLQFSVGQALGGHMRRHRASMADGFVGRNVSPAGSNVVISKLPVLRRSGSSKRVFGLDLNLTPFENDLAYLYAKMAPRVDTLL